MSASEIITDLMDSVRNVTDTDNKLSIVNATSLLKSPSLMSVFSLKSVTLRNNGTDVERTGDTATKYTSNVGGPSIGFYFDDTDILNHQFGNYIFDCWIRGNLTLNSIGEENNYQKSVNIKLEENTWRELRIPLFCSASALFHVYGIGSKGDWFEIDNPCLIKTGGEKNNVLAALSVTSSFANANKLVKGSQTYYELGTNIVAMYALDNSKFGGKNVTVSYLAKSDGTNASIHFTAWGGVADRYHQVNSNWQLFTDNFTFDNRYCYIYFNSATSSKVDIALPKMYINN